MPVKKRKPATPKKPARARRAYHHGNLQAALIEAGLELIAAKGVRALTLREIGAQVGVSRTAAYRHFTDKAALVGAIREAGFAQFADALDSAKRRATGTFSAKLTAMALAYVRFAADHPAHYEVMFGTLGDAHESMTPVPSGDRAFGILEETIREGQRAGDVRSGDSVALANLVWAQVHGVSMLAMGRGVEGRRFVELCVGVLLRGMGREGVRGGKA